MKTLTTRLMIVGLSAGLIGGALAADDAKTDTRSGMQPAIGATADTTGTDAARSMIRDWPQPSQAAAESMLDRYGAPDIVSSRVLSWHDKTPFKKIAVMRETIRHSFPVDHQDLLLQEVTLQVPVDKVGELAKFDGSLLVDRTKGTVASRCDSEKNNILALNLANEIISGKRDAESARRFMADTVNRSLAGKSSSYTDKLSFSPSSSVGDPDKAVSGSDSSSSGDNSMEPGSMPSPGRQGDMTPGNPATPEQIPEHNQTR